jgi:hypothetical protein
MPASAPSQSKLRSRHAALVATALLLLLGGAAWSQLPTPAPRLATPAAQAPQPLPPAQPTQSQPAALQPAATPVAKSYRARVEYSGNQLTIAADNSSLNEILSEIAKLSGMKITGGVNDERVYGSYGPDDAQVVLSQLLDGTGTNVVLLETPQHTLAELVLTPRNGGPTPPSPNASRGDDREEENPFPSAVRRRDFRQGGRRDHTNDRLQEDQTGEPFQPSPATFPTATPANDNTTTQPDASQPSPNGVRTPQQIYEDLVKQQAQQQQNQQQAPTTTPPQ